MSRASRRLPLVALLAANAISLTGNVVALVALPWYVLETTGSAALTGLTGFAGALPMIAGGLLGGTLVDRLGFRRAAVLSDLASAVAVALVPLLALTGLLSFPLLLALVFLGALLDAPGGTARGALLPDLAQLAGTRLERANAVEQMVQRAAFVLGAPLAGGLIAATSAAGALWVNAASFLVSAALLRLLVPDLRPAAVERIGGSFLAELREGLDYVRRDALAGPILAGIVVLNFLDSIVGLVYPVFAERELGSALDLGLLYAASGVGAVVTTVLYALVGHQLPRRRTYIASFVVSGLPLWLLTLTPGLGWCLAAVFVRGLGAGPLNPILMTVGQERIPAELRGRVLGVLMAASWLSMPLGRLVGGVAIESAGLVATLTVTAALYLATTLSLALVRPLHLMDAPPPAAATAAGRAYP